MYTHTHIHTCVCIHMCVYLSLSIYIYTYIYIYIYTYTLISGLRAAAHADRLLPPRHPRPVVLPFSLSIYI